MSYILKKGSTSRLLLVYLRDAADGHSAKVGLSALSPGASAASLREGDSVPRRIPLVRARLGEYLPGGFTEADAKLMPGVYQFGLPDAALEGGTDRVMVSLRFPGAAAEIVQIMLVAYDPQDESRLGMSALGPEGRIAALRGAFPRVAARELDEMQAKMDSGGGEGRGA